MDGSSQISQEMFQDVISFIIKVTGNLDITPSLIHVGLVQYSDAMNTRIEFSLNQYTNALHVNESLKNIVYSKGKKADLINALNVIETEVRPRPVNFSCWEETGENPRLSAEC